MNCPSMVQIHLLSLMLNAEFKGQTGIILQVLPYLKNPALQAQSTPLSLTTG
jgi:hypothetical protein